MPRIWGLGWAAGIQGGQKGSGREGPWGRSRAHRPRMVGLSRAHPASEGCLGPAGTLPSRMGTAGPQKEAPPLPLPPHTQFPELHGQVGRPCGQILLAWHPPCPALAPGLVDASGSEPWESGAHITALWPPLCLRVPGFLGPAMLCPASRVQAGHAEVGARWGGGTQMPLAMSAPPPSGLCAYAGFGAQGGVRTLPRFPA